MSAQGKNVSSAMRCQIVSGSFACHLGRDARTKVFARARAEVNRRKQTCLLHGIPRRGEFFERVCEKFLTGAWFLLNFV